MPYIYSEAWKVTNESHLLMSPLVYYFPEDKNTWGIKDQLFFGESMMVSFVTEYKQRTKDVYLPEGDWYNFWTNEKVKGNVTMTVEAPFNSTPIFIKAGSIIPMGPKIQYATQETDEPTCIKIYPGKDASYTLYFDDSESYDYENGVFAELLISYSESDKSVKIEKGRGNYVDFQGNPMPLMMELVGSDKEHQVFFKGKGIEFNF